MATIADMHAYNMLQRIGPMNEGLAMGKAIPPGKGGSPGQPYDPPKPTAPYVPAPSRNLANLADGTPDASIMNYVTEQGFFLDGQGGAYMQTGGKLYDAGEYNPDIHGLPVPLVQQMKINQDVANITPKDFSPPPFRYINHIRIPSIKEAEMRHMKNFIEAMGGSTKGLTKRKNAPLSIATHDKRGIGRNSPPASSGDNLAPDWLIDYMNRKDENLQQIQARLRRV